MTCQKNQAQEHICKIPFVQPIYSERNQNSTHLWVWITIIDVLSLNPKKKNPQKL